jgi:hypothetical protein
LSRELRFGYHVPQSGTVVRLIMADVTGGFWGIMILNGWKEIAAYVRSSVRTVQRWEKAGMPVVRPLRGSRGSVIAHSEQLDLWLRGSHSAAGPLASSLHAKIGRENLHQHLALARSLTQQLETTRLQMSGHMSLLQAEVALLRENVSRMKLAGANVTPPLSSAEVKARAVMQLRRSA